MPPTRAAVASREAHPNQVVRAARGREWAETGREGSVYIRGSGGGAAVTVLVTGATGFIGSHTAARLARAADDTVRVLVRNEAKLADTPALRGLSKLDVVVGDVTDDDDVTRALDGCDAVVHAAAHVSMLERDTARSMEVNVGGTERVVGGAVERGARVVYVSSVTVFAWAGSIVT